MGLVAVLGSGFYLPIFVFSGGAGAGPLRSVHGVQPNNPLLYRMCRGNRSVCPSFRGKQPCGFLLALFQGSRPQHTAKVVGFASRNTSLHKSYRRAKFSQRYASLFRAIQQQCNEPVFAYVPRDFFGPPFYSLHSAGPGRC